MSLIYNNVLKGNIDKYILKILKKNFVASYNDMKFIDIFTL